MENREIYVISQGFKIKKKKIKEKIEKKEKDELIALEYSNIGWYIIIPILFFLAIGLILERYLRIGRVGVVLFTFLGVIASFYNIFRILKWGR